MCTSDDEIAKGSGFSIIERASKQCHISSTSTFPSTSGLAHLQRIRLVHSTRERKREQSKGVQERHLRANFDGSMYEKDSSRR